MSRDLKDLHGDFTSRRDLLPLPLAGRPEIAIGPLVLRPALHRLEGPAGTTRIEPQVVRVLLLLAEAGGDVVARATLHDRGWPGLRVSDDAVNRAIAEIRRALRVAGADAVAVETLPRTGYRLVVDPAAADAAGRDHADMSGMVAAAPPQAPSPQTAPVLGPSQPSPSRRKLLSGAAAVAAAAVAGGLWWQRRPAATDPRLAELLARADAEIDHGGLGGFDVAQSVLMEATGRFPDSASAWGRLAIARGLRIEFSDRPNRDPDVLAGRDAVLRALALDPGQPDALTAQILIRPAYAEWARHQQRLRAVLAAHPGHVQALSTLGILQLQTGQAQAALATFDRGVAMAPESSRLAYRHVLATWATAGATPAEAAAVAGLKRFPDDPLLSLGLLFALIFGADPDRAIAYADGINRSGVGVGFSPRAMQGLRLSARALAGGSADDIAAAAAVHRASALMGHFQSVQALMFLSALGRLDDAFAVADLHFFGRGPLAIDRDAAGPPLLEPRRPAFMPWVPPGTALRRDPRFPALCRDLGLTAFWRAGGPGPDAALVPRGLVGV